MKVTEEIIDKLAREKHKREPFVSPETPFEQLSAAWQNWYRKTVREWISTIEACGFELEVKF